MDDSFHALFLVAPIFITIECMRCALYVSSGPLHFLVLLINILAFGPLRVMLSWVFMTIWLPVRALLWIMGIGRAAPKRASAAATTRYQEYRKRRADSVEDERRGRVIRA